MPTAASSTDRGLAEPARRRRRRPPAALPLLGRTPPRGRPLGRRRCCSRSPRPRRGAGPRRRGGGAGRAADALLLLPTALGGFLLSASSPRRPGGAASCSRASTRSRLPGEPHHRPPRGPPALAPQHRLAAPGLDAPRRDGVRPGPPRSGCPPSSGCSSGWPPRPRSRRPWPGGSRVPGGSARRLGSAPSPWACSAPRPGSSSAATCSPRSTGCRPAWWSSGWSTGSTARWLHRCGPRSGCCSWPSSSGAVPAHAAARRTPRDELRVETGTSPPVDPRSRPGRPVRPDRGSVWRAVPMRRGLAVLAVGPGWWRCSAACRGTR